MNRSKLTAAAAAMRLLDLAIFFLSPTMQQQHHSTKNNYNDDRIGGGINSLRKILFGRHSLLLPGTIQRGEKEKVRCRKVHDTFFFEGAVGSYRGLFRSTENSLQ